jgi:uncharacterized protein
MHGIGFGAKSAIPLNLLVSVVTLAFAMLTRSQVVSTASILAHLPEIVGLMVGGMVSASYGARLVHSVSTRRLVKLIAYLLAGLGSLLLLELVLPFQRAGLLPESSAFHFVAGAAIGLGIGLVSSVLGVAGGELLIPALIFVFGADIKTAGSVSILISLGVVLMGLWRYWQINALPHGGGIQRITLAMSAGSVIGAILGSLALGYAPTELLKLVLGTVLIAAAAKTYASAR